MGLAEVDMVQEFILFSIVLSIGSLLLLNNYGE